jgi:hypothetical protein
MPDEGELELGEVADGHVGEIEIRRAKPKTVPEPESEKAVRRGEEDHQQTTRIIVDNVELPEIMGANGDHRGEPEPNGKADWFSAGDGEVDWPAFASPRRKRDGDREGGESNRERKRASDEVRYLFPVPDSTDWDVGELRYERRSKA